MRRASFALCAVLGLFILFAVAGEAAQTGSCILLGKTANFDYYYDSSSVRYNGAIVSYDIPGGATCEYGPYALYNEIDCAKGMHRSHIPNKPWTEWESIRPGFPVDLARQKFCK